MNPYLIQGPALISFSGGRTSGYMLYQIIQAHSGHLPTDVIPCFANTGKERPETLRFVQDCDDYWGNQVHWVEWRDNKEGFEKVGSNSASRNGEPFAALIKKKGMPPNWQARFCTSFLKVMAMTAFARSLGWASGNYGEVIGLRYDEGLRIFKMLERNEKDGRKCLAPLAKAKVTERDVLAFWDRQGFDLNLKPGEGNCDLCFLKGRGLRKEIIRSSPGIEKWWSEQEQSVNGFFDHRDSYAGLAQEVRRQPDFFVEADAEHDVECGLLCEPD
jgi:3'-phosphoadenosine 5'-phosphosulfate sulfotransferase (PAPS reductase)/FAD synthetase